MIVVAGGLPIGHGVRKSVVIWHARNMGCAVIRYTVVNDCFHILR